MPPRRFSAFGRPDGFTLIELLTVMFIIAVMAAIILPAISSYRARAPIAQTERYIASLAVGVDAYRHTFQSYPPSEPDTVDARKPNVNDNVAGFYGPGALRIYMIGTNRGSNSDGYRIRDDQKGWDSAGNSDAERKRRWDPFVKGVPLNDETSPNVSGRYSNGIDGLFADAWGNSFDYFLAYPNRGNTTADIFPRAVDIDLDGSGPYEYDTAKDDGSGNYTVDGTIAGRRVRIPVQSWLDGWSDYGSGNDWARHSCPVNADSFLIVSPGPDGKFGGKDDIGNW